MHISSMLTLLCVINIGAGFHPSIVSTRFSPRNHVFSGFIPHYSPISSILPLPSSISNGLKQRGIAIATPIQESAFEKVYRGESLALHSETGSGKTLALLLPVIFRIRETLLNGDFQKKVLILAPNRELAIQLAAEVSILLPLCIPDYIKKKTFSLLTNGEEDLLFKNNHSLSMLDQKISLFFIATPVELCDYLSKKNIFFNWFSQAFDTVILDEIDLLIPGSKKFKGKKKHFSYLDVGMHPAEGILKLILRKSNNQQSHEKSTKHHPSSSFLQVLSASATLDKSTMKKLNRIMRASSCPEHRKPIPICTALTSTPSSSFASLSTATSFDDFIGVDFDQLPSMEDKEGASSEKTTLVPPFMKHYTLEIKERKKTSIKKQTSNSRNTSLILNQTISPSSSSSSDPLVLLMQAIDQMTLKIQQEQQFNEEEQNEITIAYNDQRGEQEGVGLIVLCSSLPIKVRSLTQDLIYHGYDVSSLSDSLWPDSTRTKKGNKIFSVDPVLSNVGTMNKKNKMLGEDNDTKNEVLSLRRRFELLSRLGGPSLKAGNNQIGKKKQKTKQMKLVVTDQFRTRGRTGHQPHFKCDDKAEEQVKRTNDEELLTGMKKKENGAIKENDELGSIIANVVTIAPEKDLKKLRSWASVLGGIKFQPLPLLC